MLGRRNWIFQPGLLGLNVCINMGKGRLLCATVGFFLLSILLNTMITQAQYTIRQVPDEVLIADEDSDCDPDVEARTSNSSE